MRNKILQNLDSKNRSFNSKKLGNMESRFYKSIESSNLDSKKVIESKIIKNVDCHENSCEFSLNDNNKDSIKNIESRNIKIQNVESRKAKLDSKNKQTKTSSDSLTLKKIKARSANLVSPPVASREKSEIANAEVHSPLFLQSDRLAGLSPFEDKSGYFFCHKRNFWGAQGGGFALFCAKDSQEIKNVLLKNSDFRKLDSTESIKQDSIKLATLESRFYQNIKFNNLDSKIVMESNLQNFKKLDSKTQNSQLQDFYKSIPKEPPIYKIKTNLATANFASNVDENIESKNVDSKKIDVDVSLTLNMTENLESRFYKNIKFYNLDSKKIIESKTIKSVDCHENSCNDSKDSIKNIENQNIESRKAKLDSKNKQTKTSSDSLTLKKIKARSANLVSPPNSQCKKAESTHAAVRVSAFLQRVGKAGLSPFEDKSGYFFCHKRNFWGARGGGFALFCAKDSQKTKNDLLKNSDFRKVDSIESNNPKDSKKLGNIESKNVDSKKNNVDVSLSLNMTKNIESRFYKNSNFTNLDSIKTQNQDSKNAHLPTPLTPLRKGGGNPTLTFQNIKNVNYITESKLKDSKEKLENIESRFYENIEISNLDFKKVIKSNIQDSKKIVNLDSKMQNSHSHFLCKSIPTRPPFFKINIKSANANFANNVNENIESKNVDSKKNNVDVSLSLNMTKNIESRFYKNSNFTNLDSIKTQNQDSKNAHLPTPLTPLRKGGENPTLTFQNIKNVNYITESKLKDSKEKLGNIESRFYKNIEFWNLDSKKVMESNLQNFKKLDSKTQNSHSHFLCKSIPTRPPFFKINIKSANANFANNVNENIESKNVDSKKNNVDVSLSLNMTKNIESRFYKNSNFTNLDSIKTQNQDSKNAHLPTPLTPLRKGGGNPTLTFQNIKNVNYITESKLKDSKEKLENIESRFYENIEISNLDFKKVIKSNIQDSKKIVNLDSKMQNSHSHFLCKSIPTLPPFFKINIKSANANFANNVNKNIEIYNLNSKKLQNLDFINVQLPTPLTPLRKGGGNTTTHHLKYKQDFIKNTESKNKDFKKIDVDVLLSLNMTEKLKNIESRFYKNTKINNLYLKNFQNIA